MAVGRGDLAGLLSDVAVDRLRPDSPPADLGSLREDLVAWTELFADEMSSSAGRSYIHDTLVGDPDGSNAGRCSAYAVEQVQQILDRAHARGESTPNVEAVLDLVVAPLMYRILFRPSALDRDYTFALTQAALAGVQGTVHD